MRERCICGAEWEMDVLYDPPANFSWQADRQAWRDTHPCSQLRRIKVVEQGTPIACGLCGTLGVHTCYVSSTYGPGEWLMGGGDPA